MSQVSRSSMDTMTMNIMFTREQSQIMDDESVADSRLDDGQEETLIEK